MPRSHRRLRRDSTTSSDDGSLSSASSASSSSSGSDDDTEAAAVYEPKRRKRRGAAGAVASDDGNRNKMLVLLLLLLVFLLLCAAAYYFFKRRSDTSATSTTSAASVASATSASASASDGSQGTTEAAAGGTGGGTAQTGTGGTASDSTQTTSATITSAKTTSGGSSGSTGAPGSAATTSGSTATGTSAAASSSSSSKTCKKGVGYNNASFTLELDICWAYSWTSSQGGTLSSGVMYIPQLWGSAQVDGWTDAANAAIKAGATHVLGFNEPDLDTQANLTPSAAAALWSSAMEPLATSAKLVSPAVTNSVATADGQPMGVPWLKEFVAACSDCTIDAVALHWYDSAGNNAYFQSYLEEAYGNLSKPIWLTEYMGTGTSTDQATFMVTTVDWLEKQDYIEKYAAYGDFCDSPVANFVDCDGSSNDLGKAYSDAS
ncbi:hypothetical protein JCM1840_003550 [Sporobolomyces johnsonii]